MYVNISTDENQDLLKNTDFLIICETRVNALILVSLALRKHRDNEGTMCVLEEPLTASGSVTSVTDDDGEEAHTPSNHLMLEMYVSGHVSAGKTEAFGKNPTEKSPARGANITGLCHTCLCFCVCSLTKDLQPNSQTATHGNHL